MSFTAKTEGAQEKSGMRIPGFAQLQRLGKSLMLPIAVLPAAGMSVARPSGPWTAPAAKSTRDTNAVSMTFRYRCG